jgi:hypothetical protein
MTTTTAVATLGADAVAALRAADSLSFHVHDGHASIRAYRERGSEGIYTAREQRLFPNARDFAWSRFREIEAEFAAHGYGEGSGISWSTGWGEGAPGLAAYTSISGTDYADGTWPTVANALRVGDTLTLSWVADNNSDVIRDAGLHTDRLTLCVTRGEGGKRYAFHVREQTGPDNSARMIRRNG